MRTQSEWKEQIENIAVLDRPIERGVKRQYESLLTRQRQGAFKNLKSDSFIMQGTVMDKRRTSESTKLTSRIKYYDTSRIGSGSGEMSLNRFI